MTDEPASCRCAAPGFLEPGETCAYCRRIEPDDGGVWRGDDDPLKPWSVIGEDDEQQDHQDQP